MAKLLPTSAIILKPKTSALSTDKFLAKKSSAGANLSGDELVKIEAKVIQIDKLLKNSVALRKKDDERKRKSGEDKSFEEKENELEKKKPKLPKGIKLPQLPKLGLFDTIKNFIVNTFLGFLAVRLIDHLPKLLKILPVIMSAADFIIDWGGKLLNGLVTFVDAGYKAIDGTRNFIKQMGGEGWAQNFDKFAGAIDNVLEIAVLAALATADSGGGGGPDIGDIAKPTGKGVLGRGVGRAGTRLGLKFLGKGATKAILRLAKPILGRAPIIGGLLEFGLSWALGDPLSKAAFKGVGALLIGAVGAAIGGPFGAAIGGFAGGEISGALYDMFFGGKKPQGKVAKAAGGGQPSTRGGKLVSGPAKRTIKQKKKPRTLKVTPKKLQPGAAVGGEKKIKQLYPEPQKKDQMSPFDFLKNSYNTFSRSTGLGALVALAIKPLMGDKPSYADYKNAGIGVNNWMNSSIGSGTLAYAGGGEVEVKSIISGEDYSNVIAKSIQDSVAPQSDKIIQDLMKQLMLKKEGEGPGAKPTSEEQMPEGTGSLIGNTNAEKVFNFLIGAGFTEQAAAGVIGNLMQESGVNPLSKQLGGGPGRGIMQWGTGPGSGGRWDALSAWAQSSGKDPWKLDTQVEWMMKEMRSYGTINRLKGITDVKKAVEIFEREMEKAGTPNYPRRYQFAADALVSFGGGKAGGRGVSIPIGSIPGNLSSAKQIASTMGLQVTSYVRPGDPGYHGKGRAMDFQTVGAPGNRGTPSQLSFAQTMISKYGSSLKQLIYTPLGYGIANGKQVPLSYWGDKTNDEHYHHVHVAFEKGGKVHGFTRAILGEKGPEFVIDADSTRALEQNYPGFLSALNKADYNGAIAVLQSYTDYEQAYAEPQVSYIPIVVPVPMESGGTPSAIIAGGGSGGSDNQVKDSLMYG